MPIYPDTRIKWQNLGIVPTANMAFWHMYEAGVSAPTVVADYSGNGRNLAGTGTTVLQTNVVNGQPAWYFNGTTNGYLARDDTGSATFHYFILAAHDGTAFDAARAVVGDFETSNYLISNTSGTTFQDLSLTNFTYRKNGVAYTQANQQAPMVTFELIELITSTSLFVDGIRIGAGTTGVINRWKGWWVEHMGFTQELSEVNRRRVLEYYALRYGVHLTTGSVIPLYFPSSDVIGTGVVSDGGAIRNRFYPVPRDWEPTTESYEFEDSNKTFNEFGDDPPRRWEYRYVNVSKTQAVLFDVFNDTARKANPFYFKDPEGYVWNNVRIENYSRTHDAHKRWVHEVNFNLVGYNSTATYEG